MKRVKPINALTVKKKDCQDGREEGMINMRESRGRGDVSAKNKRAM